jgi:hypothetical protein
MAELSVAHRAVLAQMLERVPDHVLTTLSKSVGQMPGERARALSQMLADETTDRQRRAVAFAPLLPMFQQRADGVDSLTFPSSVLPRLWKASAATEPDLLIELDSIRFREDDTKVVVVSNRLCLAAARVIRDRPEIVWPPAGWDQAAREQSLHELAACFDLAVLARRGIKALPALILRPTEDQLAELRLLIRDGADIAPDGGRRLVEILFAHLDEAAQVLRLVIHSSRIARREGVLSDSEMAVFVDRLIAEVEARVKRIAAFKPGRAGAILESDLKTDIAWCGGTLAELDRTFQLDPDGNWGKSAREARIRINRTLSATLNSTEKALEKVMPVRRVQTMGRMTREVAALDIPISPEAVERVRAIMTIVGGIRTSARVFGCETIRYQLVEAVIERIIIYVDLVVEVVTAGAAPDRRAALNLIETLAGFLTLIEATDAAKTARRRAAAANGPVDAATPEASPGGA